MKIAIKKNLFTNLLDSIFPHLINDDLIPEVVIDSTASPTTVRPIRQTQSDDEALVRKVIGLHGDFQTTVGMRIETFFNAKHSIKGELKGEIHAHTWKLLVEVEDWGEAQSRGISIFDFREKVDFIVHGLEGVNLHKIYEFMHTEPTLEAVANWVSEKIHSAVAPLSVHGVSITLWDTPIQAVTVAWKYSDASIRTSAA